MYSVAETYGGRKVRCLIILANRNKRHIAKHHSKNVETLMASYVGDAKRLDVSQYAKRANHERFGKACNSRNKYIIHINPIYAVSDQRTKYYTVLTVYLSLSK